MNKHFCLMKSNIKALLLFLWCINVEFSNFPSPPLVHNPANIWSYKQRVKYRHCNWLPREKYFCSHHEFRGTQSSFLHLVNNWQISYLLIIPSCHSKTMFLCFLQLFPKLPSDWTEVEEYQKLSIKATRHSGLPFLGIQI